MEAVIGGWVSGYAMAVVTTLTAALLLARTPSPERWIAADVPPVLVGVVASVGAMLGWTIVGLVAAIVYSAGGFANHPGLGSPSWPFALGSAAVASLAAAPAVVLAPHRWWAIAAHALAFAGLFGWALPYMAAR